MLGSVSEYLVHGQQVPWQWTPGEAEHGAVKAADGGGCSLHDGWKAGRDRKRKEQDRPLKGTPDDLLPPLGLPLGSHHIPIMPSDWESIYGFNRLIH